MDALTALKDEAARYRWQMITDEACRARRRERRALMLERISVYARIALFLVGLVLAGAEGPSIAPNVMGALLMFLAAWKMRGIALALMLAAPFWIVGCWVWRAWG